MKNANPTIGPFGKWESVDDKQFVERFKDGGRMEANEVCIIEVDEDNFPFFIATVHDATPGENHGASARVMTAAPELAEALIGMAQIMAVELDADLEDWEEYLSTEARAALAKAGIIHDETANKWNT